MGLRQTSLRATEFAFYGDIDFVPTECYDASTATRAMEDAQFAVSVAARVIVSA